MPMGGGAQDDGRQGVGRLGERLAAEHLRRHGYRLVETNVRSRLGEVDIVALDGQTLVFVEVRTRRGGAFGTAAESITARKQHKLLQLAEAYLAENYAPSEPSSKGQKAKPLKPGIRPAEVPSCRIDVVAITLRPDGATECIELIRNAVGY